MTTTPIPTRRTCLATLAATALLGGCGCPHDRPPPPSPPANVAAADRRAADRGAVGTYATVEQVRAMPPRTATFAKRLSEFAGSFTDRDGNAFVVGDVGGDQWVWHLVCALREGTAYRFPDVLTDFINAPRYVTAPEITAMPACTATLAARSPCSSTFRTADGKWFGIGDPGSEARVSRFIGSLEDDATMKLPDAFLAYEKQSARE